MRKKLGVLICLVLGGCIRGGMERLPEALPDMVSFKVEKVHRPIAIKCFYSSSKPSENDRLLSYCRWLGEDCALLLKEKGVNAFYITSERENIEGEHYTLNIFLNKLWCAGEGINLNADLPLKEVFIDAAYTLISPMDTLLVKNAFQIHDVSSLKAAGRKLNISIISDMAPFIFK